MTKLREMAEKIASSLDCTWNGEQGRWVSEGLIETALREVAEICAQLAEDYRMELKNVLERAEEDDKTHISGELSSARVIANAIKTRFGLGEPKERE